MLGQPVQRDRQSLQRAAEVRLGEQLDLRVEVVALAEHALGTHGERPQPVESHARAQEASESLPGRPHGGIGGGELAEPLLPQPATLEVRPEGVELLERRVHAGLDGELAQQTAGEPVDGADGRVVERVERALDDRRTRRVSGGLTRQPLELLAYALAELTGCLLREGDRRHRAHVARPQHRVEDAVHVAVDEHPGLPGAGARLQEKGRAELGGHPPADVLVADRPLSRHRCPPRKIATGVCTRAPGSRARACAPGPRQRRRRRSARRRSRSAAACCAGTVPRRRAPPSS